MNLLKAALVLALISRACGQGFGPCPNDPNLLQPYCGVTPTPYQYHTVPPPTVDPDESARFGREMEREQRQERVNACKADCPYDMNRPACERRCEVR
jgi:hypothetical protein